jgi:hypothetical protein
MSVKSKHFYLLQTQTFYKVMNSPKSVSETFTIIWVISFGANIFSKTTVLPELLGTRDN